MSIDNVTCLGVSSQIHIRNIGQFKHQFHNTKLVGFAVGVGFVELGHLDKSSNQSAEQPKAMQSLRRLARLGLLRPPSKCEIALGLSPVAPAICSCVKPTVSRRLTSRPGKLAMAFSVVISTRHIRSRRFRQILLAIIFHISFTALEMKYLAYNAVAILLASIAATLAYLDRPGWGWFLFAAILFGVVPDSDNDKKK